MIKKPFFKLGDIAYFRTTLGSNKGKVIAIYQSGTGAYAYELKLGDYSQFIPEEGVYKRIK